MTPCLEWAGAITGVGYGSLSRNGRIVAAHRVAYEDAYGPIPDCLCVCHQCDNRRCVEPSHLFLGTRAQNQQDMASKGRAVAPNKRFSVSEVQDIRSKLAQGTSAKNLAQQYSVDPSTISHIRRRVTYGDVW